MLAAATPDIQETQTRNEEKKFIERFRPQYLVVIRNIIIIEFSINFNETYVKITNYTKTIKLQSEFN